MIFAQPLTYYHFNYFGQKLGFSILKKIPENQKIGALELIFSFSFSPLDSEIRRSPTVRYLHKRTERNTQGPFVSLRQELINPIYSSES